MSRFEQFTIDELRFLLDGLFEVVPYQAYLCNEIDKEIAYRHSPEYRDLKLIHEHFKKLKVDEYEVCGGSEIEGIPYFCIYFSNSDRSRFYYVWKGGIYSTDDNPEALIIMQLDKHGHKPALQESVGVSPI